jgi:hypothetical protein
VLWNEIDIYQDLLSCQVGRGEREGREKGRTSVMRNQYYTQDSPPHSVSLCESHIAHPTSQSSDSMGHYLFLSLFHFQTLAPVPTPFSTTSSPSPSSPTGTNLLINPFFVPFCIRRRCSSSSRRARESAERRF